MFCVFAAENLFIRSGSSGNLTLKNILYFSVIIIYLYIILAGNPGSKQIEDLRIATPPALQA